MPRSMVLDASAAIAIAMAEPGFASLDRILREHLSSRGEVVAPSAFWLEVTNVLGRRYRLPPRAILERLQPLDDLGIRSVEVDRPLLLLTLDRMERHRLAAYDA